jgi:hypothetical protein
MTFKSGLCPLKFSGRRYHMRKRKIAGIIALAVFLLLICQMIPLSSIYAEVFHNHTVTSTAFYSSEGYHTDILLIGRVEQKSLLKNLQLRSSPAVIVQTCFAGITPVKRASQDNPIDYRKIIRQTIANYFNGSKYKIKTFVI